MRVFILSKSMPMWIYTNKVKNRIGCGGEAWVFKVFRVVMSRMEGGTCLMV